MTIWINEFHYDNTGTDAGEFIEIAGMAGTDLTGYSLVLYNGNGGAVYNTLALSGILGNQSNGFGTLSFGYASNGIQNGSPDGIALVGPGNVVLQFLSYEGTMTAVGGAANGLLSTDVGVLEDGNSNGTSLALTGTGTDASAFTWALAGDDTPGAINNGQSFGGGDVTAPTLSTASPADSATNVAAGANIVLTLSEAVVAGTGSFTLSDGASDTRIIAVTDATQVTISGNIVTINPTADLLAGGVYAVTAAAGILEDAAGNDFAGLAAGALDFTVATPASTLTIGAIQGLGHTSAYNGQIVTTQGVVTAVDTNGGRGFYIQSVGAGDGDARTSEGIFVFTNAAPAVTVGDHVEITATVQEFLPGGAATNLTITQLSSPTVTYLGTETVVAVVLGAGGLLVPTANIDDDGLTSYDPTTDAIDFYESIEGQFVTIKDALVAGYTGSFSEAWVVTDNGANATGLGVREGITISEGDYNPERIQLDNDTGLIAGGANPFPTALSQGDRLGDVSAVVTYNFGNYEFAVTEILTLETDVTLAKEVTSIAAPLVASYNLLNIDAADPQLKFDTLAGDIVTNLKAPKIIALQEVQDNNGAINDGTVDGTGSIARLITAIQAAGGPTYTYVEIAPVDGTNGGEPGGNIRNGYLFNDALVDLVPGSLELVDPTNTAFDASRKPLAATFTIDGENVTFINMHSSSRSGSEPLFGDNQPPINAADAARTAQATVVRGYVDGLVTADADAKIVVLGDFNGFDFETPFDILTAGGKLNNLNTLLLQAERYSYQFDGNNQQIDHILVTQNLLDGAEFDAVALNAERFGLAGVTSGSDHDAVVANLDVSDPVYRLQLLHFSDGEAGTLAPQTAPYLAALVDKFEDEFANSITLAGGDTFLPGPFLAAGTDPSVVPILNLLTGSTIAATGAAPGVVDTAIHNLIGVEASGIGNHEWDLGSNVYLSSLTGGGFSGAQYASISANLVLAPTGQTADPLNARFTQTVGTGVLDNEEAQDLKGRIAPSAIINEGGERIGLVGATTQILESISSPTGAEILGFPFGPGANGETNNMALLAAQLQPVIDDLINQGVNKIVLLSHLQQIQFEQQLAPLLRGVDIILAAGSNTRLGDADDVAVDFPGHAADFANTYPIVTAGADGKTTVIVNTDNEYTYLGRLVVDFDVNGEIILSSLGDNVAINGAYASTAENVAEAWGTTVENLDSTAFAAGTRGARVEALTDAVNDVITLKDGTIYGFSDVYLEGERIQVRNQETNLGNLTADANAAVARDALGLPAGTSIVSIKNGGGIRAQIGTILNNPDGTVTKVPPTLDGEVSQLDVENALRFNNALMVFDTTAQGLLNILNSPSALAPNNGGFIQIGGVKFSYDPTRAAGSRVRDIALIDENGMITAVVADDGVVVAGAPTTITAVVLNFTANGGDGYLIKPNADNFRFLLNDGTLSAPVDEALDFNAVAPANVLREQQALAEYFQERYATPETAYDIADTAQALDTRIQNQAVRADTVLQNDLSGTALNDTVEGTAFADAIQGLAGADTLNGNAGNDTLIGGLGADRLNGGEGLDTASYASATGPVSASLVAGKGSFGEAFGDTYVDVENLTGSGFDDVLIGNAKANVIRGGGGNDTIQGNSGLDQLFGDAGNDSFLLFASQGYASINGGDGIDTINAGANNTKLLFASVSGVEVISANGFANVSVAGGAGNDAINLSGITLTDIVAINGNGGIDGITGSNGDDVINGGAGNDSLVGGNGNDTLRGGLGIDALTGGSGADTFVFGRSETGRTQPLGDTITDFLSGTDKIDLSILDADLTNGSATNDAFTFVGFDAFSRTAGEVRINQIGVLFYIEGDVNGDGRGDFAINLTGTPPLVTTDFIL